MYVIIIYAIDFGFAGIQMTLILPKDPFFSWFSEPNKNILCYKFSLNINIVFSMINKL